MSIPILRKFFKTPAPLCQKIPIAKKDSLTNTENSLAGLIVQTGVKLSPVAAQFLH
jgi:hypothetical protein